MRKLLLAAVLALGLAAPVAAQTYTQSAGTITAGNTFQTIAAANIGRKFCLLQNTSTRVIYVYVGTLGDAATLKSFQVAANGGTWTCNFPDYVVPGTINITTTTTADPFVFGLLQ